MRFNFKLTFLIILFVNIFIIIGTAQDINLYTLTLSDSSLKDLTIEKTTNILGRPTAIKRNDLLADILGPEVYYHNIGVKFWYSSKNKDPQQRILSITIYLVRTWDKDNNEFFYHSL
ncbi:MAG: hypothetical protein HC905_02925 [Bacteroidales bacterium]|nr:hypothetical protein [Bacteroidales bacterium]